MPLRVKIQAEPFTEYSQHTQPILAISNEYRRLYRDLERYTVGQISGRSYLIAGHRGSGKTMIVYKAIEDLKRDCEDKRCRPLLVRLHGPDLLPPETRPVAPVAASKPDNVTVPADPVTTASPAPAASKPETTTKTDAEMINVLTQMMKYLFREVSDEFRKRFRESASLLNPPGLKRQELLEIAAQLDLEIADGPSASRLRSFWHRMGVLGQGVLFPNVVDHPEPLAINDPAMLSETPRKETSPTDFGLQEILVLSFLGQAYQVISGTIEEKQKQSEASKNQSSSTISTAYELKNLLAPVAGLLTGGLVGLGLGIPDPVSAVLLGLLTGAVVSIGFSYSSTRSKTRELSLESVFIKDRSVASLSGVLPVLVKRIRDIGLAPIFVVDELDKVQGLENRMQQLVKHLKFLVTENSFTCFLTDRRYLAYLNRQASQFAYAREYTYFSDHLLVLYHPMELRAFIKEVLDTTAPTRSQVGDLTPSEQLNKDEEDVERIAYVLLHRSRMHPIDLRRQIDVLTNKQSFTMEDSFPSPRYRFEILMQVAIEWLLDGEDVQTQIAGNAYSRQVVYDALYYPSRLWDDASNAETMRIPGFKDFGKTADEQKPGLELKESSFSEYIESRSALEDEQRKPPSEVAQLPDPRAKPVEHKRISGTDFDFLFIKVRELLNFLCRPESLLAEINESTRQRKPPNFILNEIPKDPSLRLMIQERGKLNYRWLYDVSGRYLHTRDVNSIVEDVRPAVTRIRVLISSLDSVGVSGGLQTMANLKVIPRPSDLRVVMPALDRLDRLSADEVPYGKMSADRDAVIEFEGILDEFEPTLKAALLCASVFAPDMTVSTQPSPGSPTKSPESARFSEALIQVCQYLQLTASREDLRKLNALLGSSPIISDVTAEDELDKVLQFVTTSAARAPTTDAEAAAIIKSAWENFRLRLNQHYQDGTPRFDALFEDVFTALRKSGPGFELSPDFSTITARAWTKLLLRSLSEDQVPGWLRVAAALELGMIDLAGRLSVTIPGDEPMLSQWVQDARQRIPPQTTRRTALVLTVDQRSLTQNWKPANRHGALVSTVSDFGLLLEELKKHEITKPADYPIDLVSVELAGDAATLGRLIVMKPLSAISAILPGKFTKDFEPFLSLPNLNYFGPEKPLVTPSPSPVNWSLVVKPNGLDSLIEFFFGSGLPPPPGEPQRP
jgi:Cdc6-like AAA superfamily ATPase